MFWHWHREASRPMLAYSSSEPVPRISPGKEPARSNMSFQVQNKWKLAPIRQVSRQSNGRPTQQLPGDQPEDWWATTQEPQVTTERCCRAPRVLPPGTCPISVRLGVLHGGRSQFTSVLHDMSENATTVSVPSRHLHPQTLRSLVAKEFFLGAMRGWFQ